MMIEEEFHSWWAIWKHRNCDHTDCGDRCPSKKQPRGDLHRSSLPPYVCEAIRPVSETLTTETLLSKCAHGGTQNDNESFQNLIWQRCPKTGFVGRPRLTLAVSDATIAFNSGERGRLPIFDKLGMQVGHYTMRSLRCRGVQRTGSGMGGLGPGATLKLNSGTKPKLHAVFPAMWIAANARIVAALYDSGDLDHGAAKDYTA